MPGSADRLPPDGVSVAIRFLRTARHDPLVRERLEAIEGLGAVVEVAAKTGFAFSVDELRAAHAHDWGLRKMHYSPAPTGTAARAASTVAVVNTASSST
jgi:hypothetical protein